MITGLGASAAGLLAGLAIFPAVFSFGLEPASGPGLIFMTLPKTFALMPLGWIFGFLFFAGLFGIAYLSDLAAFEVLVGGIVDNTKIPQKKAVVIICAIVYPSVDATDDQQPDLHALGPRLRLGDAGPGIAPGGRHDCLVHQPGGGP